MAIQREVKIGHVDSSYDLGPYLGTPGGTYDGLSFDITGVINQSYWETNPNHHLLNRLDVIISPPSSVNFRYNLFEISYCSKYFILEIHVAQGESSIMKDDNYTKSINIQGASLEPDTYNRLEIKILVYDYDRDNNDRYYRTCKTGAIKDVPVYQLPAPFAPRPDDVDPIPDSKDGSILIGTD